MLSIFHVAAFFVYRVGPMPAYKLETLCYYAQAWYLAIYNRPLFKEEIRAWRQGPVVAELYQKHRSAFVITTMEVGTWEPTRLAAEPLAMEILEGVAKYYGKMSHTEIRYMVPENEPWNVADKSQKAVITHQDLRRFYEARTPPWSN